MLQLLLAILAITIASVTGWALVEQAHLQQVVSDQRETMRRLDVAAETIQGMAGSLPGSDAVLAPAPSMGSGAYAYAQMPSNKGGFNATANSAPFLYCPLAGQTSTATPAYALPGGSPFSVDLQGGLVIGSSLAPAIPGSYHAIAVLVAARFDRDQPPSCAAISIGADGRPHVDGGIVRIISAPTGAGSGNTIGRDTADIYVDATGAGNGRYSNSATSIDAALVHWIQFKPSAMTIHVIGTVSASPSIWSDFAASMVHNGATLSITGAPGSAIIGGASGYLPTPARLFISNVSLPGVNVQVGKGSSFSFEGSILLADNGVIASGADSISSAPGAVVATASGQCFGWTGNDVTFAYSSPSNSVVPDDPAEPTLMSDPTQAGYTQSVNDYNAWRARVGELQHARLSNHSSFDCVTSGG